MTINISKFAAAVGGLSAIGYGSSRLYSHWEEKQWENLRNNAWYTTNLNFGFLS